MFDNSIDPINKALMKTSKKQKIETRCRPRWLLSPRSITAALSLAAALVCASHAGAQVAATLTDFGTTAPVPGADDISQLVAPVSHNNPDGLNYYFDNATPPGQTFTTGSNPGGYVLNSLSLLTAGDGGQLPPNGQNYFVYFYSVTGSNATLIASYESQGGVIFNEYDWLQWTGFSVGLQPNSQYAYSFQRVSSGWENMANVTNNLYTGGEVALIPTAGGAMNFGSSHNFDATFDVGLIPATSLTANQPIVMPQGALLAGTAVTISMAPAVGSGTLTYQWQTDGGSGGILTNIPSATGTSLPVSTTGLAPGAYTYQVVVNNGSLSVTSSTVSVPIYSVGGATMADAGSSLVTGVYDISQLVEGGNTAPGIDGLNYYGNNTPPPGQTFTTGTNSKGYYLTGVAIGTGGGTSGGTDTPQISYLRIYSVNGSMATLYATYTNFSLSSYYYGDWIQWNGFTPLLLQSNTVYAYTFQSTSGWAGMATDSGAPDLYTGGQVCLIPTTGGTMTLGASGTADAAFDLTLAPVGVAPTVPSVTSIIVSPSLNVAVGTPLTLSEAANGATPLHYQWQTDGGSGGTLTNIPNSNASNCVVNTTGWAPGLYSYNVIVTNSYGKATSATITVSAYYQFAAALSDIGTNNPVPVSTDDQSQLVYGTGEPDTLNYYYNNTPPAGQTFTTGNNPNGFELSSLAIEMAGDAAVPASGQQYFLRIYTMNGAVASPYAVFASQTNFVLTTNAPDWLRWSGTVLPLKANTVYAYSFADAATGSGWENLANASGTPYAGGQLAMIPVSGGTVTYGSSGTYSGTFIVGLSDAASPVVNPPTLAPSPLVYDGTPVTVSASVIGTGSFTYQWQTDGGTPGTMTNIPGATGASLVVDTTGASGSILGYRVMVTSGSGSTLSEPVMLTVNPGSAPTLATASSDTTPSFAGRFVGGSVTFTASFIGSLPITYQWQVNKGSGWVNIPGQTGTNLTLSNLSVGDSGSYSLLAVNALGSTNSTSAPLTVYAAPSAPVTVNFQWLSFEGGNNAGQYTGPGIAGYGTGTYWNVLSNELQNAGNLTLYSQAGLADDGVTPVGISWVVEENGGSWDWTSTPTVALLDSAATTMGTSTFAFYVPDGVYNLVLFSCDGNETHGAPNGGATTFTINGVSQTAEPTQDTSFVQGNNYVVFTNVVATGGAINGTWTTVSGYRIGNFNGAQVQYLGSASVKIQTTQMSGGQFQLQWSQGTLLQATNLLGPWTTNGSPSPFTVIPSGPQMYYRIRVQ
jgi:hypothetical protein